jgi:hypothetical protein
MTAIQAGKSGVLKHDSRYGRRNAGDSSSSALFQGRDLRFDSQGQKRISTVI